MTSTKKLFGGGTANLYPPAPLKSDYALELFLLGPRVLPEIKYKGLLVVIPSAKDPPLLNGILEVYV